MLRLDFPCNTQQPIKFSSVTQQDPDSQPNTNVQIFFFLQ